MTSLRGNARRASDLRHKQIVVQRANAAESHRAAKAEALARLHKIIVPGQTVYTILDHINRSQTQRQIKIVVICELDGVRPFAMTPTADVALVIGYPMSRTGSTMHVRGGGMDMGYKVVRDLAAALWPGEHHSLGHQWL